MTLQQITADFLKEILEQIPRGHVITSCKLNDDKTKMLIETEPSDDMRADYAAICKVFKEYAIS